MAEGVGGRVPPPPRPSRTALSSVLSAGWVGTWDAIGAAEPQLLLRTWRQDEGAGARGEALSRLAYDAEQDALLPAVTVTVGASGAATARLAR
jgi:hypothetical protein